MKKISLNITFHNLHGTFPLRHAEPHYLDNTFYSMCSLYDITFVCCERHLLLLSILVYVMIYSIFVYDILVKSEQSVAQFQLVGFF